jgi:hypothetical protein
LYIELISLFGISFIRKMGLCSKMLTSRENGCTISMVMLLLFAMSPPFSPRGINEEVFFFFFFKFHFVMETFSFSFVVLFCLCS